MDIAPPTEIYHDDESFINQKTRERKPDDVCAKLAQKPRLPTPTELVGSGKKYVANLQQLVREGK